MTPIEIRISEIRQQITEKDISRASRRILDLFLDYNLARNLKLDAVNLRASYNDFAALERANATEEQHAKLLAEAQVLLEKIQESCQPAKVEISDNKSNFAHNKSESPHNEAISAKGNIIFFGKNLSKSFYASGHSFHLPPLDLALRLGEITGIVGENGNGKTTLMRMVAGDLEVDGGQVTYPFFPVSPNDWYAIKNRIAYIPQHIGKWTGYLKTNLHFNAAIHGLLGEENEEQVDFIIHRLGLTKYENAQWNEISGGYKLRFELARALVWKPQLLIIDEPLAHLDINAQQIFMQDLRYLASSEKHPMAVLISSQHLHEVESIADNILFLKNGELLYNGKMRDFGSDRKENLFELGTENSKTEIWAALQTLGDIRIEEVGKLKIIHTPIEVKNEVIILYLGKAGISVQYFRDISTSTLKLFRDT